MMHMREGNVDESAQNLAYSFTLTQPIGGESGRLPD